MKIQNSQGPLSKLAWSTLLLSFALNQGCSKGHVTIDSTSGTPSNPSTPNATVTKHEGSTITATPKLLLTHLNSQDSANPSTNFTIASWNPGSGEATELPNAISLPAWPIAAALGPSIIVVRPINGTRDSILTIDDQNSGRVPGSLFASRSRVTYLVESTGGTSFGWIDGAGHASIYLQATGKNLPVPLSNFKVRRIQIDDSSHYVVISGENLQTAWHQPEVRLFTRSANVLKSIKTYNADLGALSPGGDRLAVAQFDGRRVTLAIIPTPHDQLDEPQNEIVAFAHPSQAQNIFDLNWSSPDILAFATIPSPGQVEVRVTDLQNGQTSLLANFAAPSAQAPAIVCLAWLNNKLFFGSVDQNRYAISASERFAGRWTTFDALRGSNQNDGYACPRVITH